MRGHYALCGIALSLFLSGCEVVNVPQTTTTTSQSPTTTTTTIANMFHWRPDLDFGVQTTYDQSHDQMKSLYQGCWGGGGGKAGGVDTVGIKAIENNITFVEYIGGNGVKLHDGKDWTNRSSNHTGCLMRKTQYPIDLSKIARIEMDITATGGGTSLHPGSAPWYSAWLSPLVYPTNNSEARNIMKAGEIDLIENYDFNHTRLHEIGSNPRTVFAGCDPSLHPEVKDFCSVATWDVDANKINHHITVNATDGNDGRTIHVHRCPGRMATCDGPSAVMHATKEGGPGFPIWDKVANAKIYGQYWLVVDIWFTTGSSFTFSLENIRFFTNHGDEWFMPVGAARHDSTTPAAKSNPSEGLSNLMI